MITGKSYERGAYGTAYLIVALGVLAALAMTLTGCMSSPGKRYFQLHVETPIKSPTAEKIQKVILIDSVDVEQVYNDYRVVYRLSPYELNYYSYKFWVKKPGPMVRDTLCDYFEKNNVFKGVIKRFAEGNPQLILKARVNAIEEYDYENVFYAQLDMEIEIKHLHSDKTLLFHPIARRKLLPSNEVTMLPKTLSQILDEELTLICQKLSQTLKEEAGKN